MQMFKKLQQEQKRRFIAGISAKAIPKSTEPSG